MLKKRKLMLFSLSLLSSFTFASKITPNQHVVVAPDCLLKKSQTNYTVLSTNKNISLVTVDAKGIEALIQAKQLRSKKACGGFIDVTVDWNTFNVTAKSAKSKADTFLLHYTMQPPKALVQYSIQYEKQVTALLSQLNPEEMWNDLTTLSSFPDRYANSDTGVKAANWLKNEIETAAKNNHRDDVQVYLVETGTNYSQPSVVAKIGNQNEPGVVIGAHMDTLSSWYSKKPGADDDGSGSVTILETAKTLLNSGMTFKKPLYFIWYSAEEEGIIGSGYVVRDFQKKNIPVAASIQFDMTGYMHQKDPTIWLIKDYVDDTLTAYLAELVKTYVKQPVNFTACGYACSDHASWYYANIPASMPFEAEFDVYNPDIHTSNDTMDKLSLNHMTDFAKLATAFAVELAEPQS